ncbi:hypothetical protein DDB_G0277055 [Dictyostelium discoideum AX4]|uniref:DSCP-N domain-containing protein n=1 Tax=Dictyostelium discoideum TaxID=44689 RepID=Q550N8_DICDI|nr:hypothetical protein DDB_G0277055 [Dictyostelium discoideum AX4]EAL69029.1 hypothetical protein DDB_G0277055 [Dictyostelium discoideum AX4]|eukprot:XP_642894.1 hypothetical protein DDB_G0277055 [Dictyostelium discoideum AX4]
MNIDKIKIFKYFFLLILLFILIFINDIKFIESLTGCEHLTSDLCLAAYPMCMSLILTSCCPGQISLCLDIDTVIKYLTNKELFLKACLRNLNSGVLYELWGDMDPIPGFEIIPIPNKTCLDLGCENKGLDCVLKPVTNCISPHQSSCCASEPTCSNFSNIINLNEHVYGNENCANECPDGYLCRFVNNSNSCLPSSCDYLNCPIGTECKLLKGLDVVSCFKIIEIDKGIDNKDCSNVVCPDGFVCGSASPTNFSCVPPIDSFILDLFDCSICPKNWVCHKYGWSGFCVEFNKDTPMIENPCIDGSCLDFQFCNKTSQRCEFERCSPTTCHPQMICFQYHPSSPRVCTGSEIISQIYAPITLGEFNPTFEDLE